MFGIVNYGDMPKKFQLGELMRINGDGARVMLQDIPKGWKIVDTIGRFDELELVKIKEEKDELPLSTRHFPFSLRQSPFQNIDISKFKIFGKIPIWGTPQDIGEYPDRIIIVYNEPPITHTGHRSSGLYQSSDKGIINFTTTDSYPIEKLIMFGSSSSEENKEDRIIAQGNEQCIWLCGNYSSEQMKIFLPEFESAAREYKGTGITEQITTYFEKMVDSKKMEYESLINMLTSDNDEMKTNIIANLKKINRSYGSLKGIIETYGDCKKKSLEELAKVEKWVDVKVFGIFNNDLIFKTPLLINTVQTAKDKKRKVIWGSFIVTMGLETGQIYVRNTTFTCRGHQHPHDIGGGRLCLGNIERDILPLLAEFQLSAAMMLIIDFLQTANYRDSAGQTVGNWPYIAKDNSICHDSEIAWLIPKENIDVTK